MRSELELWEILRDNLINFWTTDPRQNKGYRAMSVWGVVIVMGFRDMTNFWYDTGPKDPTLYQRITYGFLSDLTKCYVFGGAYVKRGLIERLMARIEAREVSYLSEYYHGEKLLRYQPDRVYYVNKISKLERKERHYKKNLKRLTSILLSNGVFFRHGQYKIK